VEPDLAHDIVEELHDGDSTVRVGLQQLREHTGLEKLPGKGKWGYDGI